MMFCKKAEPLPRPPPGCCTGWQPCPDPLAGFSFDPPLPTVSTYRGTGCVSRLTTSLNRSASSDCSIWLAPAIFVPSGTLAMMSNRSEATHPGPPAIASSFTLYAASISLSMVTSRLTYFPARSTPPKFCAALREVLLECTSANSNFGCWQIATPAAHKPTTTIFFIIPSNVLLIRRRPLDPVNHQLHRPLGRLQLEPNSSLQR